MTDFISTTKSWDRSHPRAKALTNHLGRMICLDFQPFSIVEDSGFVEYSRALKPKYKLLTRQYLSSEVIPSIYANLAKVITASIEQASAIALTTDMWTSKANDAYMSLTAHFLIQDFTPQSKCLQVQYFPERHTANNLAVALDDSIRTWIKTPSPIPIYVVSGNAANIVAALKQLPSYKHVPCFIHTLQLCINKSIKETVAVGAQLDEVLSSCKKIAAYFHRSSVATLQPESDAGIT